AVEDRHLAAGTDADDGTVGQRLVRPEVEVGGQRRRRSRGEDRDVAADGRVGDGDVEHHSRNAGRRNPTLAGDLEVDTLRRPDRRAEATITGAGVEDAAGGERAELPGAAAGIAGVVADDVIDHVDGSGVG